MVNNDAMQMRLEYMNGNLPNRLINSQTIDPQERSQESKLESMQLRKQQEKVENGERKEGVSTIQRKEL
jgi:hypothetical protein